MATDNTTERPRTLMRNDSSTKFWNAQAEGKETIKKELTEQVEKRRKRYADLNDLLEKRERVASLSPDSEAEKKDDTAIEQVDSITHEKIVVKKVFIKEDEISKGIEIALETGLGVHGSQEGVTKKDILEFVQKIFDLTEIQMEQAEAKSSQQPSQLQLVCKVIKATQLKQKVGNGASSDRNPYCRVAIVNQKHYHPGSEFKYLTDWQKTGYVTDIAITDSKKATLEPVWNEDIELSITNVEDDVVVVEVWDQSSSESSAKKRRSRNFKGLKNPNKEDFMGWMFHPLLLVPIAGAELKVTLMSRGKKPRNGFITLFLSIQADTEEIPLEERVDHHHLLTRALMNCFSKEEDGEHKMYWNGELCTESERLLQYHGSLNGLNQLQMACVRLSELLKYHKYESVDMKVFTKMIKKLKELQPLFPQLEKDYTCSVAPTQPPSSPASLPSTSSPLLAPPPSSPHSSVSFSSPPSSPLRQSPEPENTKWIEQLFMDLQSLDTDLMDTMRDHIRLINFGFGGKTETISPHLSTLQELYTFKPFVSNMKKTKSLGRELEQCIEPSVNNWFARLKSTVMPKRGFEPKELRDLCVYCLSWSEKVVEELILHPTFTQAGVDYFTIYIMSLDEQLSKEVQRSLENYRKQNPDTITFEIYTYFQQLVEVTKNAEDDVQSQLTIVGFHKWFEEFVPGWIDVATQKCEDRIRQAIELDEIVKITDDLKLSASAVDTNGFLIQMATFWQHLQWPVATEAYGYAMSLIRNMCNCAIVYVGEVFSSLKSSDWTDDQGRFTASEKLCVILNDMFHVRENLTKLPEHMELDKLYNTLHEEDMKKYSLVEEGGPQVSDMYDDPTMSFDIEVKNKINSFLNNTDEDIMNKIIDLVETICRKISPDIQKLVNEVVNSHVVESDDLEMVFAPLFDYLTENLVTFGNHLLSQAFETVIGNLWDVSLEAIERIMKDPHKKSYSEHHKLLQILTALREFYYCGGAGISRRVLDSERYKSLKSTLDILGRPTDQLIAHFYSDVLKYQDEGIERERIVGELILSVGYLKEESVVEVNVIHGDKMDKLTDPYIKLRLSSPCAASDKHWKTKPVKGSERSPLFNEDIKLPLTKEEMNSDGAVVFLHIIDKKSKSKGPSGTCAVACKDIPHLSPTAKMSLTDPNMTQRKNLRLPFFQLTSETAALTELISRAEDKDGEAMNFIKVDELLLSGIPRLNPKNKLTTLKRKARTGSIK